MYIEVHETQSDANKMNIMKAFIGGSAAGTLIFQYPLGPCCTGGCQYNRTTVRTEPAP